MANISLMQQTDFVEIMNIGFIKIEDGTGDPRGTEYEMENDNFRISIDCAMDVSLERKNPDTDTIKIHIDDLHDLGCLIDFIQD